MVLDHAIGEMLEGRAALQLDGQQFPTAESQEFLQQHFLPNEVATWWLLSLSHQTSSKHTTASLPELDYLPVEE